MKRIYNAPCGDLLIEVNDGLVCLCNWIFESSFNETYAPYENASVPSPTADDHDDSAVMENTIIQLDEYFRGERMFFDLPLRFSGTPFREKVWKALTEIPYGSVRSYSQLAESVGCSGGQRAAAQACSCNRITIIVPCHRVVAADGSLGGYTVTHSANHPGKLPEGLAIKQFLLSHERQGIKTIPRNDHQVIKTIPCSDKIAEIS